MSSGIVGTGGSRLPSPTGGIRAPLRLRLRLVGEGAVLVGVGDGGDQALPDVDHPPAVAGRPAVEENHTLILVLRCIHGHQTAGSRHLYGDDTVKVAGPANSH